MSPEGTGGFFQFPLCLIATRESFPNVMHQNFAHGVIGFLNATDSDKDPKWDDADTTERDDLLKKARNVLSFQGGTVSSFNKSSEAAAYHVSRWERAHGNTCTVRLRCDIHFAFINGEVTERELRVLLGIYSMIGVKPFAKIGWPMLQARAAGWLRPLPAEPPDTLIGPIYSRWQIDRACMELIARKWVSSFTYNKGERFWTHRMTAEELADAVAKRKLWRAESAAATARLNAERSASIMAGLESRKEAPTHAL